MTDTQAGDFFDLQVNGYGGIDFNQDDLTAEGLERACLALQRDGVRGILATIITEQVEQMAGRLRRLAMLREHSPLARSIIAGFHIEGPFISPVAGYRGAHPADAIVPACTEAMRRLLDAADGMTRLVTLAPECDQNFEVVRLLVREGITVSAGHTDASMEQLEGAVDAGLTLFTHLGNGSPMLMHRHDNIIQRALALAPRLWLCFIADGVHVPFLALRNYLKCAGLDRAVVVTDAIAPAGLGPGRYTLGRWDLEIGDDMVARSPDRSHFVGSAISMPQSLHNLIQGVGLSDPEARKLLSENPRRAMGLVQR